jgi:aminoglycoside phosphotransferase (APT) family kinase protein
VRTAEITPDLVSRLIAGQFPQWAGLPVHPVPEGWDNITFRLGAGLSVRLPSAARYAPQVDKEHRWLPVLARQLPLPIPEPVARGAPGCGYPWPWSVYRWHPGEPASRAALPDLPRFAADLAGFLARLYQADPAGGPPPGDHNFFRGGPVAVYDTETRDAIAALGPSAETGGAARVWRAALAAPWRGRPVWVHGDVSSGNVLARGGRLSAVIDFGCLGVGDPACDLTIAWTFFSGPARQAFHGQLPVDAATWARGRGWAVWKALTTLARSVRNGDREDAAQCRRVLRDVIAEHDAGG